MLISIIKNDNTVVVNGKGFSGIDMSCVPDGVTAIQWYGTFGEMEHSMVDGVKPMNTRIDSISQFEELISAWVIKDEAEKNYVDPDPEITLEDKAKLARLDRDELLKACDWTQLPDIDESIQLLWRPYRQALRDITLQQNFPQDIIWPEKP